MRDILNNIKLIAEKVFIEESVSFDGSVLNVKSGTITILGIDIYLHVKVTILYDKFCVEVSNVNIRDTSLRRKGIFTKLMHNLAELDYVANLVVTQVQSDEMRLWCTKNCNGLRNLSDYVYK